MCWGANPDAWLKAEAGMKTTSGLNRVISAELVQGQGKDAKGGKGAGQGKGDNGWQKLRQGYSMPYTPNPKP